MNAFPKQEMREERRVGAKEERKREIEERGRGRGRIDECCASELMEALSSQLCI